MSKAHPKTERVMAALENREADRVPVGEFFWTNFLRRARAELGLGEDFDPYRHWDLDMVVITPNMDPHITGIDVLEDDGQRKVVKTGFGATIERRSTYPMPPGRDATEETRLQRLRDGLLYRYCPDVKLHKCPTGIRGEVVTYAIPDAMNGHYYIPGAQEQIKTLRSQIARPAEQIVFLDEGRLSPSSWTIHYDQERWWDQITARHGDGTNFAFADGHSEYWKWKDPRTLEVAKMDYDYWQNTGRHGGVSTQPGNEDLHRVQRGVFGKLGYEPSQP